MSDDHTIETAAPSANRIPSRRERAGSLIEDVLEEIIAEPELFIMVSTGIPKTDSQMLRYKATKQGQKTTRLRDEVNKTRDENGIVHVTDQDVSPELVSSAIQTLLDAQGIKILPRLWSNLGELSYTLGRPDLGRICELYFVGEHAEHFVRRPNDTHDPARPRVKDLIDILDRLEPHIAHGPHAQVLETARNRLHLVVKHFQGITISKRILKSGPQTLT